MLFDDPWSYLRVVCIIGCGVCGVLLTTARYRQWDTWNVKTQDHWWALSGWTFYASYAMIESMVTGVPGGSRLIVLVLVVAFTLRALLRKGELRAKPSLFPVERLHKHHDSQ